jgi:hypothetical protein
MNKNIKDLIVASKKVSLEVKSEKIKYMLLSRHQNAGQNLDMKLANRAFENAAECETALTNQI